MSALFDLANEVVIVTGGMGQLGSQYTKVLLEHNAKVAIVDQACSENRLDSSLKQALIEKKLLLLEADITSSSALKNALTEIENCLGVPYGLINNAALDSPPDSPPDSPAGENGPFEDYSEESWDKIMAVNVKGVFLACQIFGKRMAENRAGSIINVSSIYGALSPNQSVYEYRRESGQAFYKPVAYSASKSALYNLTRYLATYWGRQGVRVNTLTLGGVFNNQDNEFLKNYCDKVPIGRMADETEFNSAVIMLLAKSSRYITGSTLTIDGGWSAW